MEEGECGEGRETLVSYISIFILLSLLPKGQTFGYSLLYWVHIAV